MSQEAVLAATPRFPVFTPRLSPAITVLVAAHLIIKIAMGFVMIDVRPSGDEWAYMDAAKALSNAIRDLWHLTSPDLGELKNNVVGNGWFMPGMPILATPLYLLFPDADIASLRLYLGMATFALWLLALLAVRRSLGELYACVLLVFPSLVPLWVMFSFTFWADLSAGLVVLILFAHAYAMTRQFLAGDAPTTRQAVVLGVLSAATLYLRSSTLPLLLPLFPALALTACLLLPKSKWATAISRFAIGAAVCVALVLPWSIAASKTFKAPVVTTTSTTLSSGITFGDKHSLCFGPCDRGIIWLTAVRYSRQIALTTGKSEISIQKQMARNALTGVTLQSYLSDVADNFQRYLFLPTQFTGRFVSGGDKNTVRNAINAATKFMYTMALLAAFYALVAVFFTDPSAQVASILLKLFLLSLLLQPFFHASHGRYWAVFAPCLGLALAMGLQTWRSRTAHAEAVSMGTAGTFVCNALVAIQAAMAAGTLAVGGLILWFALHN